MTSLRPLPPTAAWRHLGAHDGTEILVASSTPDGHRLAGSTSAVDERGAWNVGYVVLTDARWRTRTAEITSLSSSGARRVHVERRSDDTWLVDGEHHAELDGCVDVDLESSAVTNTLPVHRLPLQAGQVASVPAVFVRVDLQVQRLEQTYERSTSIASRTPRRPSTWPARSATTTPGSSSTTPTSPVASPDRRLC